MPLLLCWTPNIESNVLETANIAINFWGPYAEQHLLDGSLWWIASNWRMFPLVRFMDPRYRALVSLLSTDPKYWFNIRFRPQILAQTSGSFCSENFVRFFTWVKCHSRKQVYCRYCLHIPHTQRHFASELCKRVKLKRKSRLCNCLLCKIPLPRKMLLCERLFLQYLYCEKVSYTF